MKDKGFPHESCVMKPHNVTVFSFPMKSPQGSVTRTQMTAIEQLELWLIYQRHWCEHKPSVTISVKEEEWMEVGAWVWKHLNEISGISFLPFSDHVYKQAPYQDINKETYEEAITQLPKEINWEGLSDYEKEDNTSGTQTYACSGGSCEVVDLTD